MRCRNEQGDLLAGYGEGQLSRRQFVEAALGLGFSVAGTAGLLSACHSSAHKAAPKKLSGRVQILVGFDGGNTATERQVQQTLAQAFIAAHPQVGIDFLRATSATAAATQLQVLTSRGSAPDIVLGIGLADVARLADQHLWLDIRPLLTRDGLSTNAFSSQAVSAAALSSYYGGSKVIPGLPVGVNDHALACNMDLFAKAGLSTPPPSWTDGSWTYTSTFLQAAQKLTVDQAGNHAGQPGFDPSTVVHFGAGRIQPEAVFFSFGGQMYDAARRQARFDTPAAIQGAQFAADLVSRYHVQPSATEIAKLGGAASGDNELAAWRAGKLAMIDMASSEINSPFGDKVPFAWRAAALPAGPVRRFGFLDVSLGALVAATTHRDVAWEVLKFLAVDPAHEATLASGGFNAMPALTANGAVFSQATKQAVGVDPAVWSAGLGTASADNDSWIPAFSDVHTLFSAAIAQIQGGAGATTVMPQLQRQAQAKIDAWFKANQLPK